MFFFQFVFRTNSSNSVTTHEVLAAAVTVILKQTADFNTCNKLLKVTKLFKYCVQCCLCDLEAVKTVLPHPIQNYFMLKSLFAQ